MPLDAAAIARFHQHAVKEYAERHPVSLRLHQRALGRFPGGNTRTITHFEPFPPYVDRGEACRLYDVDGHALLDLLGNYTSMIWGSGHPKIVDAVQSQIARGSGFAAPTESQVELAERIAERLPSVERLRFANSGTEAAMNAIRLARAFTGRRKIVKMEGGYHGSSDVVEISVHPEIAAAGRDARPRAVPENAGIVPAIARDVLIAPFNNVAAVHATARRHRGEIAALVVEPVMGVAGVIRPREGFLEALRQIADEHGILLVFDEVISFRLDYHGAQGAYAVRPDLTVLGKIIGGGLPVGAFGGRADVMALTDPGRPGAISQSGTFNANPVTMAAGIAGLELLTASELTRINGLGERLRSGIQEIFDRHGIAARVNGIGSLLNVLFTDTDVVDYRSAATSDPALTRAFHLGLLLEGVFIAPRGLMAVSLPMTDAEIDETLSAVRRVAERLVEAVQV